MTCLDYHITLTKPRLPFCIYVERWISYSHQFTVNFIVFELIGIFSCW